MTPQGDRGKHAPPSDLRVSEGTKGGFGNHTEDTRRDRQRDVETTSVRKGVRDHDVELERRGPEDEARGKG